MSGTLGQISLATARGDQLPGVAAVLNEQFDTEWGDQGRIWQCLQCLYDPASLRVHFDRSNQKVVEEIAR